MKRAAALLLVLATAPSVWAQRSPAVGLEVHAGFAFHEENNLRPGTPFGVGLAARIARGAALSLSYDRWTSESFYSYRKLYDGRVDLQTFTAALRIDLWPNRIFFPYVFAGAAWVVADFRIGPYASIPEIRIEQRIRSGPGPVFGLGARLVVFRPLSFFAEASYLRRTAPAETVITDMNSGTTTDSIVANLRTVFLRFGFRLGL